MINLMVWLFITYILIEIMVTIMAHRCHDEGAHARNRGIFISNNKYSSGSTCYYKWRKGWFSADRQLNTKGVKL